MQWRSEDTAASTRRSSAHHSHQNGATPAASTVIIAPSTSSLRRRLHKLGGGGRSPLNVHVALRSPPSLLFVVGVVLGLAVTMCLQSLSCLPPIQRDVRRAASATSCRRPADDDGGGGGRQLRNVLSVAKTAVTSPDTQLLLVGVMTAQKYIDTRAWTVWRTWARRVPGEVIFFVSEDAVIAAEHADMPVVRLRGADDTYPPQKKSFLMLRWMADYGLNKFQWFLRADDDLYVRGDRLELFLRSIDHHKPHFIGQAGRGTAEEYGTLSLADNENYCMGGPGILFSRETLRLLRPHLAQCLKSMYTTHEDVEVGRCVKKHVGITCTWSYEMQNIFHSNQSGALAYTGDLNVEITNQAITLHPLKAPSTMLHMHAFVSRSKAADLRFRHLQLSRDMRVADRYLALAGAHSPPEPYLRRAQSFTKNDALQAYAQPPSLLKFTPSDHAEVLPWDFLSASTTASGNNLLYCAQRPNCPRHNVESYSQYAVGGVVTQIFDYFNRNARQRGRVLEFQKLQYGYRRVDPVHGVDYILDILLLFKQFRRQKATVSVRRHAYVQQGFAVPHMVLDADWRRTTRSTQKRHVTSSPESMTLSASSMTPQSTPAETEASITSTRIHMIVPLSGRVATLRRFADNFRTVCLTSQSSSAFDGPVSLVVVWFRHSVDEGSDSSDEDTDVLSILTDLSHTRHLTNTMRWIDMGAKPFSRGLALAEGSESVETTDGDDALLFFTDVDIMFTAESLYRIRRNTIRGIQVYFPVVFSEYAQETHQEADNRSSAKPFQYGRTNGYFRQFGFGIVSIYKSDLARVGGVETSIRGWGKEDVDLFEKCLSSGGHNASSTSSPPLRTLRAVEPTLVHGYHRVLCDPARLPEAQYRMCQGSRAATYGAVDALADRLFRQRSARVDGEGRRRRSAEEQEFHRAKRKTTARMETVAGGCEFVGLW